MHNRKYLWPEAEEANDASVFVDGENGLTEVLEDELEYDLDQLEKDLEEEDKAMQSAGFTGGKGGGNGYVYKSCDHDGFFPEIDLECGISLSGARGTDLTDWSEDTKLIIDCAGMVKLPTFPTVNNFVENLKQWPKELEPEPLKPHCPAPPILNLKWPDQGAPQIEHAWWSRLLDVIVRDYFGHVIIACVGGHGRTGTAMAALMLVDNPGMSVREAVETVRAYHCKKSVESMFQFRYLGGFRPKELDESKWLRYEAGLGSEKP